MLYTLVGCCDRRTTTRHLRRLRERIEQLLVHPFDHPEITRGLNGLYFPAVARCSGPPEISDCLYLRTHCR